MRRCPSTALCAGLLWVGLWAMATDVALANAADAPAGAAATTADKAPPAARREGGQGADEPATAKAFATSDKVLVDLPLPRSSVVRTRVLRDAGTVVIDLAQAYDDARLQQALQQAPANKTLVVHAARPHGAPAYAAKGAPAAPEDLRLYLHVSDDVYSARVIAHPVHGKPGARILVRSRGDTEALLARIMHYYVPQISAAGDTAAALHAAEALLLAGKVQGAIENFSELLAVYPLKPWAELRLADVALLQRGREAGCSAYLRVHRAYETRAASFVAGMHAAVLNCEGAPTDNRREWESVLLRAGADDPASRWLADEAHWALSWTHDLALVRQSAAYGPRVLGQQTFDNMVEKVMLMATPLEVASFAVEHKKTLHHHPDAVDLQTLHVLALCNLELNKQADELAQTYARAHDDRFLRGAGRCISTEPLVQRDLGGRDRRDLQASLARLESRLKTIRQAALAAQESP